MVDFSQAQRRGFIEAFADFQLYLKHVPPEMREHPSYAGERNDYRLRAEKLLKGCEVHWQRMFHTVARNGNYVPVDRVGEFWRLVKVMKTTPSLDDFRVAETSLRNGFPSLSAWIDWWTQPAIASMIFTAFLSMDPALYERLPNNTNPAESLHNSLNVATGTGNQLLDGAYKLLLYTQRLQTAHEALQGMRLFFSPVMTYH